MTPFHIFRIRKQSGLDQISFAKYLQISRRKFQYLEKGVHKPKHYIVLALKWIEKHGI